MTRDNQSLGDNQLTLALGPAIIRTETDYQIALAEAKHAQHRRLAETLVEAAAKSRHTGGRYAAIGEGQTIEVQLSSRWSPGIPPRR